MMAAWWQRGVRVSRDGAEGASSTVRFAAKERKCAVAGSEKSRSEVRGARRQRNSFVMQRSEDSRANMRNKIDKTQRPRRCIRRKGRRVWGCKSHLVDLMAQF